MSATLELVSMRASRHSTGEMRASRHSTGERGDQALAAVMPTVDSITGFILLSRAS